MNIYLVFKVLHILFMVSWFAGIFYLPRLFVYHVESENQETKDQLTIMQANLIKFITPIGLLALFFGLMMGFLGSDWIGFFSQKWIIVKIFVVLTLVLYQIFCVKIIKIYNLIRITGLVLSCVFLMSYQSFFCL